MAKPDYADEIIAQSPSLQSIMREKGLMKGRLSKGISAERLAKLKSFDDYNNAISKMGVSIDELCEKHGYAKMIPYLTDFFQQQREVEELDAYEPHQFEDSTIVYAPSKPATLSADYTFQNSKLLNIDDVMDFSNSDGLAYTFYGCTKLVKDKVVIKLKPGATITATQIFGQNTIKEIEFKNIARLSTAYYMCPSMKGGFSIKNFPLADLYSVWNVGDALLSETYNGIMRMNHAPDAQKTPASPFAASKDLDSCMRLLDHIGNVSDSAYRVGQRISGGSCTNKIPFSSTLKSTLSKGNQYDYVVNTLKSRGWEIVDV